ncbi:MAG: aminotransferase class I/II-fold pyridoxal phosphate-dependent enzyme [Clostridia bacterium]|nr:aminotransferase class I/II-fold pyridoxal phosphate-dependent enzyme [Clostridia bacterium]
MKGLFRDKKVLKTCHIYQMLRAQSKKRHASFHTPGHKRKSWDITELSYSDNLSAPRGCIAEAEKDIARILGAKQSFILTDGSTSGVLAMLYAAKTLGARTVAVCENPHKSVFNGCAVLGLQPLVYGVKKKKNIPLQPTMSALKCEYPEVLLADALFFTSPDYYGNTADWEEIRKFCDETGKWLLVDGAHGGHLHFDGKLYAGGYADFWVDGVHKSLPAFTQGAVVSAKDERCADALQRAVDAFRTTSPSYPIMASVEYAVKYPRNEWLERQANGWIQTHERIYAANDWTKICAVFGDRAFEAEKSLESEGIYAEFCDGNIVMFYLSPYMSKKQFSLLTKTLRRYFIKYPLPLCEEQEKRAEKEAQRNPAPVVFGNAEKIWLDIDQAIGHICAENCGLFPPCTPLIKAGERIEKEKIELMKKSINVYGVLNGKIKVLKEKEKE